MPGPPGRSSSTCSFTSTTRSAARLLSEATGLEATGSERDLCVEKLGAFEAKLGAWAQRTPPSFLGYHAMVEAEKARAERSPDRAMAAYTRAIEHAADHGQVLLQAMATEQLGTLLALSHRRAGLAMLEEARDVYVQYGARAKAQAIDSALAIQRPVDDRRSEISLTSSTQASSTFDSGRHGALDLGTVMKAAQAISGEIELRKLLQRLVRIVSESAGAQRCLFVLVDGERMVVEAEGEPESDEVRVLEGVPLASPQVKISRSIVSFVARTQQAVVLADAAKKGAFVGDPYVLELRPRSIMCVPLIHQAKVTGILYLENNLAEDAFTPARLEVLKLLSAHVASALVRHGHLYTSLEEKVHERTAELSKALDHLRATQQQLVDAWRSFAALGSCLVGGVAHEISTPVGNLARPRGPRTSRKKAAGQLRRALHRGDDAAAGPRSLPLHRPRGELAHPLEPRARGGSSFGASSRWRSTSRARRSAPSGSRSTSTRSSST